MLRKNSSKQSCSLFDVHQGLQVGKLIWVNSCDLSVKPVGFSVESVTSECLSEPLEREADTLDE